MPTKPTKYPEWANNDVVNPTTSQNNVVEPSQAQKDLGWDYNQKPPRQYFNWLGRLTNAWIQWFDQGIPVPNFLTGCETEFDLVGSDRYMQVNPGSAASSDNTEKIVLAASLRKKILTVNAQADPWYDWAEGADNGACPASFGNPGAYVWLHFFLLYNPANGNVDAGVDDNISATNLMADSAVVTAGYTKFRRVGSFLVRDRLGTDVHSISYFWQNGDWFRFIDQYTSESVNGLAVFPGSSSTITLTHARNDLKTFIELEMRGPTDSANNIIRASNIDMTHSYDIGMKMTLDTAKAVERSGLIRCNGSGQILMSRSSGSTDPTIDLIVRGWFDNRGKDGEG